MAVFEIPLSPQPQKFSIQLGQVTYNMRVFWCEAPTGGWVLDINDSSDVPIANGIPLTTGADLLRQLTYLGIGGGGQLVVQTDFDANAVPTFENLGVQSHLYFVTPDP